MEKGDSKGKEMIGRNISTARNNTVHKISLAFCLKKIYIGIELLTPAIS